MNRKGSKSSRSSSHNNGSTSNKALGGTNGSSSASSKATGQGNDVSGSAKKLNKSKKSSKGAAKQVQVNSAPTNKTSVSHQPQQSSLYHQHSDMNGIIQSMASSKVKFPEPPKKLERSHSFISRGFSKLYSSITGSRDGINKIPEDKEVTSTATSSSSASPEPPKFRRSLTLGSFSIKRRSMRESALEKLSEENESRIREDSNSTSPRDSHSTVQSPSVTDLSHREKELDWNDNEIDGSSQRRRMSFGQMSLADIDKDAARFGSGLMSRLKRTLSITSEKRKQMNPMWSASLQNLQSIDNMVSYNDLSFIDYDKFNEIDKRYEVLTGSQMQLNRMSTGSQSSTRPGYERETSVQPMTQPNTPDYVEHPLQHSNSTKSESSGRQTVKRREHKFSADHTKNLDEGKNLYRQSLDSQKLQFLNERNRETFRFSSSFDPKAVDYLLLDKCAQSVSDTEKDGELASSENLKCVNHVAVQKWKSRRRNSEPILKGFTWDQCRSLVSGLSNAYYLKRPSFVLVIVSSPSQVHEFLGWFRGS